MASISTQSACITFLITAQMGVDPSLVSAMFTYLHHIERQLHYCERSAHFAKTNLLLPVLPDEDGPAVLFCLDYNSGIIVHYILWQLR